MRKADTTTTRRFTDDDGDWIELRVELTKGQRDALGEIQQNFRMDPRALVGDPEADYKVESASRIAAHNLTLFEFLCVKWSLDEEPTGSAYAKLDSQTGDWIDACMLQALRERQDTEGKGSGSSKKRSSSRSAAREANASS